jgi:hypothetical protein
MRRQVWEVARAVSILLNTLTGGESRETLCGRCYRHRHNNMVAALAVTFFNRLFFWDVNHCRRSNMADGLVNSRHWSRDEALRTTKEVITR